jgi:pimeloyl-ACP methyl ester carboxylesterase
MAATTTSRSASVSVSAGEKITQVVADDGTRLFVRSRDGEPGAGDVRAFLSDGVACDGFIWKYLWDDLPKVAPVTHWHYRGHGRSAPPANPDSISIVDHARDLCRVREALGDPPCVLIGHSMGCQVLLESYRAQPENVRGLVLLCGSSGKVTSTFHGGPILEKILPRLQDLVRRSPDLVRAVWSRLPVEMALKIALKMGEVDAENVRPEDLLPYLTHVTSVDVPMFLRMVQAAGEHSAEDLLPCIKVPTLIIAGERDTFTPGYLAEAMHKSIPGAELLLIERGSHVAPIEQPQLVDGRIAQFFRERVLVGAA